MPDGAGSGVGAGGGATVADAAGEGAVLGTGALGAAGFVPTAAREVFVAGGALGAAGVDAGGATVTVAALVIGVVDAVVLEADEASPFAVSVAGALRAPIIANAPPPIATSAAPRRTGRSHHRDPAAGTPATSIGSPAFSAA